MPDLYTQEEAKKLLIRIYGNLANNWEMNDNVLNFLIEFTYETRNCSNAYSLVPLPSYGVPNLAYLGKNTVRVFRDLNIDDQYISCIKSKSRDYRYRFELAGRGL